MLPQGLGASEDQYLVLPHGPPEKMIMPKSFCVGIALGGGGARGIAHLGVLSVLEQAGIPIDVVAGTSFGALIGAMYSIQPDVHQIQKRIAQFLHSPAFKKTRFEFMRQNYQQGKNAGLFSKLKTSLRRGIFYGISFRRRGYISEEEFLGVMGHLIENIQMEDTRIPLIMSSADLMTGEEYILEKGSLQRAVCATCALPGIFPPVSYGEHLLIDGGWVNPVPVDLARRRGADFVIAVDTSESLLQAKGLHNGLDLLLRADAMVREHLMRIMIRNADVVIRPEVGHVHWADFSHAEDYFREGMKAAQDKVKEIQQFIRRKKIRKIFLG
jgi:NTE family protein